MPVFQHHPQFILGLFGHPVEVFQAKPVFSIQVPKAKLELTNMFNYGDFLEDAGATSVFCGFFSGMYAVTLYCSQVLKKLTEPSCLFWITVQPP